MKISTTRIYDTIQITSKDSIVRALGSMDVEIQDIRYPEDIEVIRDCLATWNEELIFDFCSENNKQRDTLSFTRQETSLEYRKELKLVRVKVCRRVEMQSRKKKAISVLRIYNIVLRTSIGLEEDPDGLFEVFFGVLFYLRSQGYYFDWDSRVLYDRYRALCPTGKDQDNSPQS